MQIIHLAETASTNNYATTRLQTEQLPEGTIVLTFRQTHGRGQAANAWESEDFRNLTFSLVLRPRFLDACSQFFLSQVVSLGIHDLLSAETGGIRIKWPNDILIGERKVAGILIENSVMGSAIDWTVAGIGLNLNQQKFGSYSPEAVSLGMVTQNEYAAEPVLEKLYEKIMYRYRELISGNRDKLHQDYLEKLFRYMEWCRYEGDSGVFEARISGTDEYGRLILEDRSGSLTIWPYKTIRMLDFGHQR